MNAYIYNYILYSGVKIVNWKNGSICLAHLNGDKFWYLNGKLHRADGPAVELFYGYRAWWLNSKRHRTDGPAIEYADGRKTWCLDGKYYTEEEFNTTQSR